MDRKVEEVKRGAEIVLPMMKNHLRTYSGGVEEPFFKSVINAMHIAGTADKLAESYYDYAIACINMGYSNDEIIAGIMQNDQQNKKFRVDIDAVIKSILKIHQFHIELYETDETTTDTHTAAEQYSKNIARGNSTQAAKIALEPPIKDKAAENIARVNSTQAAHTTGGFNISNFVKDKATDNKSNYDNPVVVFPHQICRLTDDQIVQYVAKHFKVLEPLPAYALYDLANNKLLARKFKELGAQRPNNLYLTQVNIDTIHDVETLNYNTAFTAPCKDKNSVIVVLFNTTPENTNGILQYPLSIFKTAANK